MARRRAPASPPPLEPDEGWSVWDEIVALLLEAYDRPEPAPAQPSPALKRRRRAA
jgi:hypothetical protein